MKKREVKPLTDYAIIHNSGQDLWDYLFEGQRLKNFEAEEEEQDSEWYDEGIQWLTDELYRGEVFQILEDNPVYAITSMGRLANIKRKTFKALVMECHSIQGNITGGAVSVTKMVREIWNIDLKYDNLPAEVQMGIRAKKRGNRPPKGTNPMGRPRKNKNGTE
jgi:hypothetical protein